MTFIEQFENIKKKMSKLDTSSLPHDLAIQVNLTDEDCGGIFYVANIGGVFAVEPYDYYDHTVLLTSSAKNFLSIVTGKTDATDAVFRGLINLEGNIEHAQALANLVKKPEKKTSKKPAAKKTAEKKTSANKSAEKKAAEKKTAANKSAEKKAAEKKTAAKKPAEKKAVEKKTAAKKPAEKKAVEKKTVAKKASAKASSAKKATKK